MMFFLVNNASKRDDDQILTELLHYFIYD